MAKIDAKLINAPNDVLWIMVPDADEAAKWRDMIEAHCPTAVRLATGSMKGGNPEFYLIQGKLVGLIVGGAKEAAKKC